MNTVIPLRAFQSGSDKLMSRSQVRAILQGIKPSPVVTFDFEGVESIGQAFADEVFRVFKGTPEHPDPSHAERLLKAVTQEGIRL